MTEGIAPYYSARLGEALRFAADAFASVRRKGTEIPYLSHLLQVVVHVAEHGGNEDQLIAAVLHDYLEDIEGASPSAIADRFGARVAWLVQELSDATTRPKPPWRQRKVAYLDHLRVAEAEVKLISAADKLHNARAIHRDLGAVGDAVWDRFNANRDDILWYYDQLVAALANGWSSPLLAELAVEVDALRRAATGPR